MSLKPAYNHVFYRNDLEWNLYNILSEFYQNRGMSLLDANKKAEEDAFNMCIGDPVEEFLGQDDIKRSFKRK